MMKIKLILVLTLILLIVGCSKDGYRIEGSKVVYESPWNTGNLTVIHDLDADPLSFEVLGNDNLNWARDKNSVFWGYIKFDFMDSATFEVINVAFAKDKNHVICGRDIIKETNPIDFKLRTRIDKYGRLDFYGVDKHAAYLCSSTPNGYIRIPSKSIESFVQLGKGFYKDKEVVTWQGLELPDARTETFRLLGGKYATDGNRVYYTNDLVKNADVDSFYVIDNGLNAKDKNHKYLMDEIDD